MVKDAQVGVLRRRRMEGKTQEASAAAAAMSVRSARKWQHEAYPSQRRKPHTWRTRPDPFGAVFETDVVPLLAADDQRVLETRTILGELDRRQPGEFSVRHLRTLQRRIRQWRALNGPDKEVFFPQEHPPGREEPTTSPSVMNSVSPSAACRSITCCSSWRSASVAGAGRRWR
jgi:hypothetical protein